jgi:hypothetical protein
VERWVQGESFDYLMASHDGYHRLQPSVTHQRQVVSLRNGMYLVRDVATGQGRRRLDIAWHLGQDLQLVEDGLYRIKGASQGLALLPAQGQAWAEEVRRESWSPAYGQKAPMTTLNFTTETVLPAQFAVLLVTLKEAHKGAMSFSTIDTDASNSGVSGFRYVGDAGDYVFMFGSQGHSWRLDRVSSDAEFVCVHRQPGSSDRHLIFAGGSYAVLNEEVELRFAKVVEWAELVLRARERAVFSSDMGAVLEKTAELPSNPVP